MSEAERMRLTSELLAAYLEDEVPASERVAIEAALRDDPRAQRKLEQLRHIASSLSAPAVELEHIDLAARVRAELASPQPAQKPLRNVYAWAAGLAVAASVGLVVGRGLLPSDEGEFRAKDAGANVSTGERWSGIQIHRALTPSGSERLGAEMRAADGLVFSYTNLGPKPFGYLMIFALDASHEVRWFYPQYEVAGQNPGSVPIQAHADVPLGDVVAHDYAQGPMQIHALFTREPLNVLQVEAWLKDQPEGLKKLPIADASLQVVRVRVTR